MPGKTGAKNLTLGSNSSRFQKLKKLKVKPGLPKWCYPMLMINGLWKKQTGTKTSKLELTLPWSGWSVGDGRIPCPGPSRSPWAVFHSWMRRCLASIVRRPRPGVVHRRLWPVHRRPSSVGAAGSSGTVHWSSGTSVAGCASVGRDGAMVPSDNSNTRPTIQQLVITWVGK